MSAEKSWPEGTFFWENENREHYCGSHWDPFFDSPDEIFESVPEIIPRAVPMTTFGDRYSGPWDIPDSWTKGGYCCWPNSNQGLIATLSVTANTTELVNLSPFAGVGTQITIDLQKVHVWTSGAEAQIEGDWNEASISFFDLTFLSNRSWYEAGQQHDFILAGIAYEAGPPKVEKLALSPESPLANWQRTHGAPIEGQDTEVFLEGSSIFVPVVDWDRDDYWFRGPVRSVEAFEDWLGQSGWRVRVCVMRLDGGDAELDVFVTHRVWSGTEPPHVGQDIDGSLWLQGHLWSAM